MCLDMSAGKVLALPQTQTRRKEQNIAKVMGCHFCDEVPKDSDFHLTIILSVSHSIACSDEVRYHVVRRSTERRMWQGTKRLSVASSSAQLKPWGNNL